MTIFMESPAAELFAALDIKQKHLVRLLGSTPRNIRRWRDGSRAIPYGIQLVLNLLRSGTVTVAQVEQASRLSPMGDKPVSGGGNGRADPEARGQAGQ
jgi:hypothetical protein